MNGRTIAILAGIVLLMAAGLAFIRFKADVTPESRRVMLQMSKLAVALDQYQRQTGVFPPDAVTFIESDYGRSYGIVAATLKNVDLQWAPGCVSEHDIAALATSPEYPGERILLRRNGDVFIMPADEAQQIIRRQQQQQLVEH